MRHKIQHNYLEFRRL